MCTNLTVVIIVEVLWRPKAAYTLTAGYVCLCVMHQSFETPASRHGWGKAGITTSYLPARVSLGGGVNTHFHLFIAWFSDGSKSSGGGGGEGSEQTTSCCLWVVCHHLQGGDFTQYFCPGFLELHWLSHSPWVNVPAMPGWGGVGGFKWMVHKHWGLIKQ